MIMRMKFPLVLLFAGAVSLAGCSIGGGDTYTGVPVGTDGVTVQGTGSVKVVPDGVAFSFSVTIVADSTQSAVASVASAADEARSALLDAGVDEEDIATQSVSVYPEYTYSGDGTQTLKGYRATQNFAVTLRDTDRAGEKVDAVVEAAGDAVQINSVTPVLIDTTDASNDAREKAIDNAKDKAEDYADLLDVDLGDVLVVTEVSAPSGVTPILARDSGMVEGGAKTQIDLGVQEVSVTVEVRWALSN
ncbi:MAG: SIMPL domain-containing protein [Ilumatobacteraceae bacterium]